MAMNKHDRAELAQEMKKKKIEVDESTYYSLLKDSITLKALRRGGVDNWEFFGDSLDDEFDAECIEKLPPSHLD